MRVVFLQPYYHNVWEAIGLGYIIAYCKKHYQGELHVEFYQGNFDSDDEIIAACEDADILAVSATSPCFAHGERIAKDASQINDSLHVVFGGWHVSALKEKVLESSLVIDQIVVGEGEEAMLRILNGCRDRVVYGNKPHWSDLPWPDREAIKNHRTIDLCEGMNGHRITSFQANRVCPVKCIFCAEHTVTGTQNRATNPIRSRDPMDTLLEINQTVRTYKLDYFKFVDATFDISAEFVIDFCKTKINMGLDTAWECLVHPAFATKDMFYWLAKSNCKQINMGCESGSDKVLKKVGKGTKVKTLRNVFKWAKDQGVERRGFFILGMPNEDREDIRLTEELIDEIEPDVVGFTILCPYPGSDLYDHGKYKDIPWSETDEYSNDFWSNDAHTNRELKAWQAFFTTKYEHLLCERQEVED